MTAPAVRHAAAVLDAGKPDEALRLIGAHLAHHPDDASALRVASDAQRHLGRGADALVAAEQAARLEPDSVESWRALAFARNAVRDFAGAVDAARHCVQLAPHNWTTHANLSLLAGAVPSDSQLSLNAAREAVRLAPNVSQAHQTLGNALLAHKQVKTASAAFSTALTLDPQNEIARHNLAIATMRTGHPAAAVTEFANLAGRAPGDGLATGNLRVAIGNTLGQIHSVIAGAAIVAFQVIRIAVSEGPIGTPQPIPTAILVGVGVLCAAVIVFLVVRTRRALGPTLMPVVRFVLTRDRMIAGWAVVDALALLPILVGPALPEWLWPIAYGFGWLFVVIGIVIRVVRARIVRNENARRADRVL